MRILAIETTEKIGSVAAVCDGNLLENIELNSRHRTAQSLAPSLQSLVKQVGWQPADVELVAVSIGPGSFTGLRIGVTTAKLFAYAVGAEVLGIDTLETIAAAAPDKVLSLCTAIDAGRGDVITGEFQRGEDGWFRPTGASQLVAVDVWTAGLAPGTIISGPALRKTAGRVPDHITMLDHKHWSPKAENAARLADRDYDAGRRDDVWSLAPKYSRRSAAEEKWDKRADRP